MNRCVACNHVRGFHAERGCALCINLVIAFQDGRYAGKAPTVCREYRER